MNSILSYRQAAQDLVSDDLGTPALAEAVLKKCKVHPERPPYGAPGEKSDFERLDSRNEFRRRSSLVLAALAQPAARGDREYLVDLTALAAAIANEMTPHNPPRQQDHEPNERA